MTTNGRLVGSRSRVAGRRLDAHQRVVGGLRQLAAVDDGLVVEHEHRRVAGLRVLEVLVAALAQHVPGKDRALPGVEQVFGRGLGRLGHRPEAGLEEGFVCHGEFLRGEAAGIGRVARSCCSATFARCDSRRLAIRQACAGSGLRLPPAGGDPTRGERMKLWSATSTRRRRTTSCASSCGSTRSSRSRGLPANRRRLAPRRRPRVRRGRARSAARGAAAPERDVWKNRSLSAHVPLRPAATRGAARV